MFVISKQFYILYKISEIVIFFWTLCIYIIFLMLIYRFYVIVVAKLILVCFRSEQNVEIIEWQMWDLSLGLFCIVNKESQFSGIQKYNM